MKDVIEQFNNEELLNIFEVAWLALTNPLIKRRIEDLVEVEPQELVDLQRKLSEAMDSKN
jgi:hypothetical protein